MTRTKLWRGWWPATLAAAVGLAVCAPAGAGPQPQQQPPRAQGQAQPQEQPPPRRPRAGELGPEDFNAEWRYQRTPGARPERATLPRDEPPRRDLRDQVGPVVPTDPHGRELTPPPVRWGRFLGGRFDDYYTINRYNGGYTPYAPAGSRSYSHGRIYRADMYDPYSGEGYIPGSGRPMVHGLDPQNSAYRGAEPNPMFFRGDEGFGGQPGFGFGGERWREDQRGGGFAAQPGPTVTVQGRIDGFRHYTPRGGRETFTQVLLRLPDGESAVADLGPRNDLADLGLRRGDVLAVRGRGTSVDGEPALEAEAFRLDGEVFTVRREEREQWGDAQTPAWQERRAYGPAEFDARMRARGDGREREVNIDGVYDGFARLYPAGMPIDHAYIQLRVDAGAPVIVDLGPKLKREQLRGLAEAGRVSVEGKHTVRGGLDVIKADRVEAGDVSITVERDEDDEGIGHP